MPQQRSRAPEASVVPVRLIGSGIPAPTTLGGHEMPGGAAGKWRRIEPLELSLQRATASVMQPVDGTLTTTHAVGDLSRSQTDDMPQ